MSRHGGSGSTATYRHIDLNVTVTDSDGTSKTAQAFAGLMVSDVPTPKVLYISDTIVKMVDNNNTEFKRPQYNRPAGVSNPIAVPIRATSLGIAVGIRVDVPPKKGPFLYTVRGVNPANEQEEIVQPTNFTADTSAIYVLNMTVARPTKVQRYPGINWKYTSKFGPGEHNMLNTTSPLYILVANPLPPQAKPRWDVVDYAVSQTNGASADSQVKRALTTGINTGSGFFYDVSTRAHHTDGSIDHMTLKVSDFIPFPGRSRVDVFGNCADFSNLFQVCSAALGVDAQVRRIDGKFQTTEVNPAGWPFFRAYILDFHQTGWAPDLNGGSKSHYDPAYRLSRGSPPPIGISPASYEAMIRDFTKGPQNYLLRNPVTPIAVK